MPDLLAVTTLTNLLALSLTLWLGLYIVLRSPTSRPTQLAALALWSAASYFFCNALLLNMPGNAFLSYLRQMVLLVVPAWYHLTLLLRENRPGSTARLTVVRSISLVVAYAGALLLMLSGVLPSDPVVGLGAWLQTSQESIGLQGFIGRAINPLYSLFLVYLFPFAILSLRNLWQLARSPQRSLQQSVSLIFITSAIAVAGSAYSSMASFLRLDLPTLPLEAAYAAAILLLGYAVARYDALLGGRPLERDFIYSLAASGSLTLVYVIVTGALYWAGYVSFLALVILMISAVVASSILDQVRLVLDRLLYRKLFQELRGNLRRLASEAGTGEPLHERLAATLGALIRALDIDRGIIARREGECWVVCASRDSYAIGHTFPLPLLMAKETASLDPPLREHLGDLAVLSPIFADGCQTGALVLGQKRSGQGFTILDLELVEDLGLQIELGIRAHEQQEQNAEQISTLVADFRVRERALQLQFQQLLESASEEKATELTLVEERMVGLVEDGLRRLQDYDYLGEHELSRLRVVTCRLESGPGRVTTFIDTGKALSQVLVEAVCRLKPEGKEPAKSSIPAREWHPYIVLHDAYVLGEPNRNIMSRLYVSQGTFNRTRRRALRAVAKALVEMEEASKGKDLTHPEE